MIFFINNMILTVVTLFVYALFELRITGLSLHSNKNSKYSQLPSFRHDKLEGKPNIIPIFQFEDKASLFRIVGGGILSLSLLHPFQVQASTISPFDSSNIEIRRVSEKFPTQEAFTTKSTVKLPSGLLLV